MHCDLTLCFRLCRVRNDEPVYLLAEVTLTATHAFFRGRMASRRSRGVLLFDRETLTDEKDRDLECKGRKMGPRQDGASRVQENTHCDPTQNDAPKLVVDDLQKAAGRKTEKTVIGMDARNGSMEEAVLIGWIQHEGELPGDGVQNGLEHIRYVVAATGHWPDCDLRQSHVRASLSTAQDILGDKMDDVGSVGLGGQIPAD